MAPRSTSKFAANLVVDHSREIVDRLITDLEQILECHAEFEQWLKDHGKDNLSHDGSN